MRTFAKMPVEEIIENNKSPHMVRFWLSTNCNYNCTMCCGIHSPIRNFQKRSTNLSFQRMKDTLDYLQSVWCPGLVFSGVWEPFMHPKIYDILEYIAPNFILVIQTNLSLVNIEKLKEISFNHQLTLSVNFNAVSQSVYKRIYWNQPYSTLKLVLKKARALSRIKNIYIRLIYIVSQLNKQDVIKTIMLADRFGFDLHLEFSNEFSESDGARILNLTLEEKVRISYEVKAFIAKRDSNLQNIINTEEFFIQCKGNRTWLENISYCNAPYLYARIEEDGRVFTCNNTSDAYLMGNINEVPFEEIWNSQKYKTLREKTHKWILLNSCCHNNLQASWGNYKIRYFINQ